MNVKNVTQDLNFVQKKSTIDPFTITAVLHSSLTYLSGKMTILQKNHDFINTFNSCMTLFYGKVYYYHSQMSHVKQDHSYHERVYYGLVMKITIYIKFWCQI